jgi:hypothetical protein
MRYTEGTIPRYACCEDVLQIFSVRVTETKDGLEWPLHVYGWVATRDSVDQNRNLLFNRTRDNCQILTQEVYIHLYVCVLLSLFSDFLAASTVQLLLCLHVFVLTGGVTVSSSYGLVSICAINFVISLYLVLLISI